MFSAELKTDRVAQGRTGTINQHLSELPHLVWSDVSSASRRHWMQTPVVALLLHDSGSDCMFHNNIALTKHCFISLSGSFSGVALQSGFLPSIAAEQTKVHDRFLPG